MSGRSKWNSAEAAQAFADAHQQAPESLAQMKAFMQA